MPLQRRFSLDDTIEPLEMNIVQLEPVERTLPKSAFAGLQAESEVEDPECESPDILMKQP